MTAAPSFADVRAAADRIHAEAVRTPLLPVTLPSGGLAFVKAENLQRTGSFKFRGAFNRVSQIPADRREAGVVAFSSGNHGQGVAESARLLGIPATIVMPSDAPETKIARTRAAGATIVAYDRRTENREAIVGAISADTGATFVHPFDDPGVIAGQGTIGIEIAEDCAARGLKPDAVLVCTAGGGLAAGIATALEAMSPETDVRTVEPAGFDDYARSLQARERRFNERMAGSVCDALMAPAPGPIGFSVGLRRFGSGLVVTDDEALAAVAFAAREMKLLVEPGGAVALAALLTGRYDTAGRTVVAVLSGGNIDDAMLARALGVR